MQRKRMVTGENTIEELTFEEVFGRYQQLINRIIKSYCRFYDKEELYQVASMGLWEAFRMYDMAKAAVAFGYLARLIMQGKLYRYHRNNKKHFVVTHSLNSILPDSDNEAEYIDRLKDETDYEKLIIFNLGLTEMFKTLNDIERKCMTEYMGGKSQVEISRITGLSQPQVSRRLTKAKDKLRAAV